MTRQDDIRQTLAYALNRLNLLKAELRSESASEGDVQFVGQKVGEILSLCRECFDYCAKDLNETFLASPKDRAYFPFNEDSLRQGFVADLKILRPDVASHVKSIVDRIVKDELFNETLFSYGVLAKTNQLVNNKKHNVVTKFNRRANSATRVKFAGGAEVVFSPMMPFDGDRPDFSSNQDAMEMVGSDESVEITYISEYRLRDNNWEVSRYCWHALEATWRVLEDIYIAIFGTPVSYFNPHQTIKDPAQIKFEAALVRASPIVTRLMFVGLKNGEEILKRIGIDFDGTPKSTDADDIAIANDFLDVYLTHGKYLCEAPLSKLLEQHLVGYEREGYKDRYCEVEIPLATYKELLTSRGDLIRFNSMVFGLGTRFQCSEAPLQLKSTAERTLKMVSYIFERAPTAPDSGDLNSACSPMKPD